MFYKVALISLIIATGLLKGCASGAIGNRYTDAEVNRMGIAAYQDIKDKLAISKDIKQTAFVRCVTNNIISILPISDQQLLWEINLFDDPQINAFAIPGGKVGVHEGLFKVASSEQQLAAVLGHEIAHILLKHTAKRLSTQSWTQTGLTVASILVGLSDHSATDKALIMATLGLGSVYGVMMPFSRKQETEADLLGQKLMVKAGYDPSAAISLWQNMLKSKATSTPEFLSTHPSGQTRINNLMKNMQKLDRTESYKPMHNCSK
jgi:predicted Zn-dependent protease